MRNLRNTQHVLLDDSEGLRPSACTWDVNSDSILCIYGPSKDDNGLIQLKRWRHSPIQDHSHEVTLIASWDSPSPSPDVECDSILSLKYFSDTKSVCIILEGGDIVVVRENPLEGENKIEIVGSVDSGISAAAWSPDEDLLGLATKDDTFLFMTRDFDVVTSTLLQQDDLESSKHVSVGWGRSETQFKGRRAKALRDPTMPERVDEGLPSTNEDHRTMLSWRGDGAYVAVNSPQASSRRVVRIYSREGVLDGVSEPIDSLESAVSWRPAGNLLACVQRTDTHIKIIFFERNGLRHGDFLLRLTLDQMSHWGSCLDLSWNADSTVLAISFRDRLQLWTMGNHHYYLKQELVLAKVSADQRASVFWHPEQPLLLVATTGGQSTHRLEFVWYTCRGSTIPPNDNGAVAVIDGANVKITALRLCNVPPPMAQYELVLDEPAIDVTLWDDGRCVISVAILTFDAIYLYAWNIGMGEVAFPTLVLKQSSSSFGDQIPHKRLRIWPQQLEVSDATNLYLLFTDGKKSTIAVIEIVDGKDLVRRDEIEVAETQELLAQKSGRIAQCYASFRKGEVARVDDTYAKPLKITTASTIHTEVVSLAEPSDTAYLLANGSQPPRVIISLTKSGSLYADDRCLASNCTSFLTTASHLVYTTSQHLLKFLHIATSLELEVPPDTPETDERCRSIERGARLVTVVPSLSAAILQMPRGNLETVYPRALVLAEIRRHLMKGAYKKAYMYCRNHRVDMNFLHDYDSRRFLRDVPRFIEQIPKPEHIDLFLAQLRNEDVSSTMYRETLKSVSSKRDGLQISESTDNTGGASVSSKVNRICDAFLEELQRYRQTHLQNVITAHCCKEPPDLESGLLEVSKMSEGSEHEVERAIEHISFLVDVNKLYDTALGLYDIRLAHLVAQQSQKDPREYLPFLQALRNQPTLRMRFDIDSRLGRYRKCLKHLQELDAFEEVKTFTLTHHLYEEALALYRRKDAQTRAIMRLYADHLSSMSKYSRAGVAYDYLGDYTAASEAYRLAHMWQEALACAGLVPMEKGKLIQFAHGIAESLVELKSYHAAATIYLDYLEDVESGLRMLCRGYHFAEAIRILALRNRVDLLEDVIDPGLAEGMSATTELIADCKAQLNAQVPRIRELRIKKVEAPLAYFDADVNGDAHIPDNVSLAGTDASTSGGTLFTRYTNRTGTIATHTTRQTSKNRRREERKKARGKKGSVYEEEYLVNSVARLFDRVNSVNEEVGRLVLGLVRRGMREQAMSVETAMLAMVGICNECKDEVFQIHVEEGPVVASTNAGAGAVVNSVEALDEIDTNQTQQRREAHSVKGFERVSLFGG